MKSLWKGLSRAMQGKDLRGQLLRGSIGGVGLKFASISVGLISGIVLARVLGAENYGTYSYVFAIISLIAIPAQFGLPNLVMRETAKANVNGDWSLMRGLWWWSSLCVLSMLLLLVVIGVGGGWLYSDKVSADQLQTFAWGLAFIPLIALGSLRGAALRGLQKVVQGLLPDLLIRPVLLVCFVLLFSWWGDNGIKSSGAMAMNVLAASIAFLVGAVLLWKQRPKPLLLRPTPRYEYGYWVKSAVPFALVAGIDFVNTQTDIVMLGIYGTSADVGVYKVAASGASLVSFGFMAISLVVLPFFARLHADGDMKRFQRLSTASVIFSFAIALPAFFIFLLFGKLILELVFGLEYVSGYSVLVILSIAQIVSVFFGMAGRMLNMMGYQNDTWKGMAAGAVCNVVLNAILIPIYGSNGAALATAISVFIWNMVLWRTIYIRTGIDSSILSVLKRA